MGYKGDVFRDGLDSLCKIIFWSYHIDTVSVGEKVFFSLVDLYTCHMIYLI